MQLHFYGGYFALGLILFRIVWGLIGTYHARFSTFLCSPLTAMAYLRGKSDTQVYLGHNPAGAYSVLAILAVMLSQSVSGLFMTDDIFLNGPYYGVLDGAFDDIMSYIHHNAITVMWVLIALHVLAITYYTLVKKQALIPAMLHGKKERKNEPENNSETDDTEHDSKDLFSNNLSNIVKNNTPQGLEKANTPWIRFIVSAGLCALIVYLVVSVFAPEIDAGFYY